MATLKMLKFTFKIFLVLNILVLCSCVDKSNLRQKYTDSQNMNIKSEVSFIIEREFLIEDEKEKEQIPSLIKFNRFGNIISSSKNNVLNSYDGARYRASTCSIVRFVHWAIVAESIFFSFKDLAILNFSSCWPFSSPSLTPFSIA